MDHFAATIEPRLDDQGVGWEAFSDQAFILQMGMVLLISVVLSAVIAYHPSTRARASTVEDFEQPKTYILYSMVGSLIAVIVKIQPSMALVVFGIGGLLRFRTHVGEAKDTGRVILVTVVGLCCGLELFVVAVLATIFGWLLILLLERRGVARLVVQGLSAEGFSRSAEGYARLLRAAGCVVLGEQKNVKKGTLSLVFRAPRTLDFVALDSQFSELPEGERGATEWDQV